VCAIAISVTQTVISIPQVAVELWEALGSPHCQMKHVAMLLTVTATEAFDVFPSASVATIEMVINDGGSSGTVPAWNGPKSTV
jgi:hypothetical protein